METQSVEVPEEEKEEFRIKDSADLDWALARLGALRKEVAENNAAAAQAVFRINARRDRLNATVERGIAFFTAQIAFFCEQNRKTLLGGGKKKSRALIHGTVGWKKTGGAPVIRDQEALLKWAQAQSYELGFLRIKEEPAWDAIKEHAKTTGELPPGVELSPEAETFEVKTVEVGDVEPGDA